jgi:hypothetical protein
MRFQCNGITLQGKRCKKNVKEGNLCCHLHKQQSITSHVKEVTTSHVKEEPPTPLQSDSTISKCDEEGDKSGQNILNTPDKWIKSFEGNKNTCVSSEINTGLELLKYPNIIGLINVSQNDSVGGTGDIGIVFSDKIIHYFSVTTLPDNTKCMNNPSPVTSYNLKDTEELIKMNEDGYQLAVTYRQENWGETPNEDWKRKRNCPGTKLFTKFLALNASNSWNHMDKTDQIKKLAKFLDLNETLKPNTKGIIYWNKKTKSIDKIYEWTLKIRLEDYCNTFTQDFYIYHGTEEDYILKTQAKFNSGVIEGMHSNKDPKDWELKKSTNYKSWNCKAPDLSKIFRMTEIKISDY